ncbi:MAG: hypothetical protein PHP11_02115 [Erysipelotrichaceae bacterium]|nr:hypothetical protein [Erysipelotrichaceae bacterium]MDD3923877.1 hypothetical protein [Erysipelotrichaceae bacterium]
MNRELPKLLLYSIITLFVYNLIPVLALVFPNALQYYTSLLDTWILIPIYVFVLGIIVSTFNDLCVYLPVLVGILYLPTILIFYSFKLYYLIIIYVILNFVGGLFGSIFYRKRLKQEY